ncbi:adenine-specific DNA-methyltransferase [Desulfomicrobium norvegicum]|uniref:site-specific DNA-methyltransferase (adenine-specific) n=1 Tax=Desulfomicrobium norvegicum (strain DSM 1741 / NCIMB 8310) TaxID=52561 RepID=A0A8G2C410_DESNO|nr:site-specific DNA-methyltransferase [Desulfomicrobium norvegicum]SFL89216.1 adenine-specific DNA-methyltransferase [Desulfomicrobium norvegicum]
MAKNDKMKTVETIVHDGESRKNIPSAELQPLLKDTDRSPIRVAYERRNRDLDPQIVWRGKDEQDWSDLIVHAAPLYIQEHVHPKALIDDLQKQAKAKPQSGQRQLDMFSYFEVQADAEAKTEFYQHDAHWSNRMILGDSLQVMASLAEREGLRGKVQCIYFDPPYGIKFNSNFQWSTTSRDVKDGKMDHITREPEQVKAFRDTWRDGIHSYLTYLRDRLTIFRDLLTDSGSVFVQIGEENIHRIRVLMDEIFGSENSIVTIIVKKKSATTSTDPVNDFILWYSKNRNELKLCTLFKERRDPEDDNKFNTLVSKDGEQVRIVNLDPEKIDKKLNSGWRWARVNYPLVSQDRSERSKNFLFHGKEFECGTNRHWTYEPDIDMRRLEKADRIFDGGGKSLGGVIYWDDWSYASISNIWTEFHGEKFPIYVVQTNPRLIERCLLMASDPGDIVLDPTCGSGTTAYVAEQWGRRWITIDTSRVALALARTRIMGARYPYYLLADSPEGQAKEAEVTNSHPSSKPTHNDIRHGFVYERVPHITLKSITNNAEIDVIWEDYQERLEPLRQQLNKALKETWEEWEIPRQAEENWPEPINKIHAQWWKERIARQQAIDASIAAKADFEHLYDKPYEDKKKVRVAGPFTVESLSPHRTMIVDENDALIDPQKKNDATASGGDFVQMILENLKISGVQQAHKEDKISFVSLTPWAGDLVCAEGHYLEGDTDRRAAIFIGPEFGTVQRADLVSAAREASDADFDVLIACAFSYEAHTTDFSKLGRLPVLKARMNADLHMAEDLKNTGKGNLFVIFGEPDIDIITTKSDQIQVKINGVDVFHPNTGEVRSDGADGIACWFIDTDYNEESFFVRHAYFLGANDPYKSLKTTLKAEINEDAWASLNSDISRPFDKPQNGRIAVKVINHLGDEVMKVFKV